MSIAIALLPFACWVLLVFYISYVIDAGYDSTWTTWSPPKRAADRGFSAKELYDFPIVFNRVCQCVGIVSVIAAIAKRRIDYAEAGSISLAFGSLLYLYFVMATI